MRCDLGISNFPVATACNTAFSRAANIKNLLIYPPCLRPRQARPRAEELDRVVAFAVDRGRHPVRHLDANAGEKLSGKLGSYKTSGVHIRFPSHSWEIGGIMEFLDFYEIYCRIYAFSWTNENRRYETTSASPPKIAASISLLYRYPGYRKAVWTSFHSGLITAPSPLLYAYWSKSRGRSK